MTKLAIGQIRTSHGIKGLVKVRSYSGEVQHFHKLKQVELRLKNRVRVMDIEKITSSGDLILMKFRGVDTPEDAKLLRLYELWVEKEQAAPLGDGEFYQNDLAGCELIYNGAAVGKVKAVVEARGRDMLEVEKGTNSYFVPFQEEFIGTVSIQDKNIELLAAWIIDED